MNKREYEKIKDKSKKRFRESKDLVSFFKLHELTEHYLSENYFKLTQKRIKGDLITSGVPFLFKNDKLDEIYIYENEEGILHYANPPLSLEIPYPISSEDLWPKQKK
jgi:hypothetical protein